ncbi:MAG: hypothetical protein Q9160_000280 [Pyrenula sp. 1 TL-2023]
MFTNAMLRTRDITTLIRDTEPHERALFSVDPNSTSLRNSRRATRRATAFPGENQPISMAQNIYAATDPRKTSAVARVLGGDTLKEIEKARNRSARQHPTQRGGDIDKKCAHECVTDLNSSLPGVPEKIHALRNQYEQAMRGVAYYETKVAQQTIQLETINNEDTTSLRYEKEEETAAVPENEEFEVTDEDLRAEEEEIREIEEKKRALQERVAGMEKDLGGLLR